MCVVKVRAHQVHMILLTSKQADELAKMAKPPTVTKVRSSCSLHSNQWFSSVMLDIHLLDVTRTDCSLPHRLFTLCSWLAARSWTAVVTPLWRSTCTAWSMGAKRYWMCLHPVLSTIRSASSYHEHDLMMSSYAHLHVEHYSS